MTNDSKPQRRPGLFWRIPCLVICGMLAGLASDADAQQVQVAIANGSDWAIQARAHATVTAQQGTLVVRLDSLSLAAEHGTEVCGLAVALSQPIPGRWDMVAKSEVLPYRLNMAAGQPYTLSGLTFNIPVQGQRIQAEKAWITLDIKMPYKGECVASVFAHSAQSVIAPVVASAATSVKGGPASSESAQEIRPDGYSEAVAFIASAIESCRNADMEYSEVRIEGGFLRLKKRWIFHGVHTYSLKVDLRDADFEVFTNYVGNRVVKAKCRSPGCAMEDNRPEQDLIFYDCGQFGDRIVTAIKFIQSTLPKKSTQF